jgi:hypothetical protein
MTFAVVPGWGWWAAGLAGATALVLWLARALPKGGGRAARENDSWGLEQLAVVIARRAGVEAAPYSRALLGGDGSVIPADLDQAELRYERVGQPQGGVKKSLVVRFCGGLPGAQTSTVEVFTEWTDLPTDVRAEMIRTGQAVTRTLSLPAAAGRARGEG